MKKVKIYYVHKNPFVLNPDKLRYSKTIEIPEDMEVSEELIVKSAKQDAFEGYEYENHKWINK